MAVKKDGAVELTSAEMAGIETTTRGGEFHAPPGPDGPGGLFEDDGERGTVDLLGADDDEEFEADIEERKFVVGKKVFKVTDLISEPAPEGKEFGYYLVKITAVDTQDNSALVFSKSPKASWKLGNFLEGFGLKGDGGKVRFKRSDVVGHYAVGDFEKRKDNMNRDQQDFKTCTPLNAQQREFYASQP